jgi:spore maturation protein CgeB
MPARRARAPANPSASSHGSPVNIVIFGLTISSAWGNGHATLWRALCRALGERGHRVVFFERDVPYYAAHRDCIDPAGCDLRLYSGWSAVRTDAANAIGEADVVIVTSYCPDGREASIEALDSSRALRVFYDLDTPVTLERLRRGERVPYIPDEGLGGFDLVLSYTGGRALDELRTRLGARRVAPLYGSVDPTAHRPVLGSDALRADLSYMGTYAADRQDRLQQLFIEPARRRPDRKFLIGGSQYPADFPWARNIYYVEHLAPPAHPQFYSSSAFTLNVTRGAMAEMGYCPSGRLFEAAACRTPIVTDWWEGIDTFFEPGREILVARSTDEVLDAMELAPDARDRIAAAACERALAQHTASSRARELEEILAC